MHTLLRSTWILLHQDRSFTGLHRAVIRHNERATDPATEATNMLVGSRREKTRTLYVVQQSSYAGQEAKRYASAGVVGCVGLWAVGRGPWAVGCGLWAVGCGL